MDYPITMALSKWKAYKDTREDKAHARWVRTQAKQRARALSTKKKWSTPIKGIEESQEALLAVLSTIEEKLLRLSRKLERIKRKKWHWKLTESVPGEVCHCVDCEAMRKAYEIISLARKSIKASMKVEKDLAEIKRWRKKHDKAD